MTSAIEALRHRTAACHERVDRAFSGFDLADAASYRAFLVAHARALPAAEAIGTAITLPPVRPRTPLLAADLATLGVAMPVALGFAPPTGDAAAWGVRYVVEGSRLGGGILAKRVGAGLPHAYLSARHEPGEWRAFAQAIDQAAAAQDEGWIDDAIIAAEACFDLYAAACQTE